MDVDMPPAPTPAVRSTIHVPRTGPTPAPRNTTATTQPTVARSATRANPTPVPADPQRLRCPLCRRPHRLPHCGIFKRMLPPLRQQIVQAHGHCLNCLAPTHSTSECTSGYTCQICMRPHHTLLHRDGRPLLAPSSRATTRRPQANRAARTRRAEPPPESRTRTRRQQHNTSTRRRQPRPRSRQPTGLSNVVATLQQLQRLLG